MKIGIKIFDYLKADKYSDIRENVNFYIALGLSFIISLLLTIHPTNLDSMNELGNIKWLLLIAQIIGFTGLSLIGIFGYLFLIVISVSSIKRKIKEKSYLSILGTVLQFIVIIAMTWPIIMLVIRPFAKLYLNITIPDFL
ncbi:hypothetical protein WJN01_14850 [Flavobacteriaceae bacterium SZ-1-7]|uniref:hypothetical protein n=1 Tax=Tamlana sedimenti TaxID=3134126 RepID=UPI003120DAE4